MTVKEALLECLAAARKTHSGLARPVALLWTDEARVWERIIPLLRDDLPELLVHGSYVPGKKEGPAAYLLPLIDRMLPDADWSDGIIPIVYIPGVGGKILRAGESCPWELQPLAALRLRANTWHMADGKEWSPYTFLSHPDAPVCWKLSHDPVVREALTDALPALLDRNIEDFRGRTLTAQDFHHAILPDQYTEMLSWLENEKAFRQKKSEEEWKAFAAYATDSFKFDPGKRSPLEGVKNLAENTSKEWEAVWKRFEAQPEAYPGVIGFLEKLKAPSPDDLFSDVSRYPAVNLHEEAVLREKLASLVAEPVPTIRKSLPELEAKHGPRRIWLWAGLGRSPLAVALGPLSDLANATGKQLPDSSYTAVAAAYMQDGWKADSAYINTLSVQLEPELRAVVEALADRLYRPWLESVSVSFQNLVRTSSKYPAERTEMPATYTDSECVLFLDGLRMDVGRRIEAELSRLGLAVESSSRYAAVPTVTENAKPACSPAAYLLSGDADTTDFSPVQRTNGKSLSADAFKKLLKEADFQFLPADENGDGKGRAWTEIGDLDRIGHSDELISLLPVKIESIVQRIQTLLSAGWKRVRIVTDHGWLYLKSKLPKTDLPKDLVVDRGERCARLAAGNAPTDLQAHWYWNPLFSFQAAPGISCFKAGLTFSHGGLSPQECIVPELIVTSLAGSSATIKLVSHSWLGQRLKLQWSEELEGYTMDLRAAANDVSSSYIGGARAFGKSLLVEDDELEGKQAFLVVLDLKGHIVVQEQVRIGG